VILQRSEWAGQSRPFAAVVRVGRSMAARLRRAQERANGDNLGQAVARASPQSRVGVGPSQRRQNNENRKHAFGCVLSGTFGRYVDITRLGAVPSVGGGRCTMSDSGRESISDRRRILGYEERSRTCVPGLPSRPWLSSLVPCRLRNARSGRQPRQHPANLHRLPASVTRRAYGRVPLGWGVMEANARR
jgi:hypothetical protein